MKLIDILILLPILWGGFIGYQRGIIIEVISIAAFIISVIIGFRALGYATDWVSPYMNNRLTERIMPYIGFGAVFFPIVFLINKLGWLLRRSIKYTVLGSFDSFAGAIVGAFTWSFGISIFIWLITSIGIRIPVEDTKGTFLYPLIKPLAPGIIEKAIDIVPKQIDRLRQ
ncbi:membrane protein required for colicin V production [Pseudarcicella hirudinis]|uniref:Membrane protein required for colicin V production n=1 Tax=Pseudarcicella hirudinis TaxID=1079859 RepID=A0A1I5XJL1_9BACT|nr:CvpA family protein [Pseudarcicella hirudinis]SFQ32114.1 membrane protein required for colicin V production [Pseudarcicella hirudinis]